MNPDPKLRSYSVRCRDSPVKNLSPNAAFRPDKTITLSNRGIRQLGQYGGRNDAGTARHGNSEPRWSIEILFQDQDGRSRDALGVPSVRDPARAVAENCNPKSRVRSVLDQAQRAERDFLILADDHVVMDHDLQRTAGCDDLARHLDVRAAGRRVAGRMIMDEDQCAGV